MLFAIIIKGKGGNAYGLDVVLGKIYSPPSHGIGYRPFVGIVDIQKGGGDNKVNFKTERRLYYTVDKRQVDGVVVPRLVYISSATALNKACQQVFVIYKNAAEAKALGSFAYLKGLDFKLFSLLMSKIIPQIAGGDAEHILGEGIYSPHRTEIGGRRDGNSPPVALDRKALVLYGIDIGACVLLDDDGFATKLIRADNISYPTAHTREVKRKIFSRKVHVFIFIFETNIYAISFVK